MRLTSVRLHPFAGQMDKTYDFKAGLNVIEGPNEFGKSTLFKAIMHGFHAPVNLTAGEVTRQLSNVFPKHGGDVIRVTIEFNDETANQYALTKEWKPGNKTGSVSLKQTNGVEITQSESVQSRINVLLGMSTATMRSILLADQGSLQELLAEYSGKQELRKELGDILTQSVMQTGGVSIDALIAKAQKELLEYSGRWDWEHNYPDGNKGVQDPWLKGVGRITSAYYISERTRLEYESTDRFEKDLDQVNGALEKLLADIKPVSEEHSQFSALSESVQLREVLEQKVVIAKQQLTTAQADFTAWITAETKIPALEESIRDVDRVLSSIVAEQQRAIAHESVKQLSDRMQTVERHQQTVARLKSELDAMTPVSQEQLERLRELVKDVSTLETKVEAAKITVKIEAKVDETVTLTAFRGEAEVLTIASGEALDRTLTGAVVLETSTLRVSMVPGDGNLLDAIQNLEDKRSQFQRLLGELNVNSVSQVEALRTSHTEKSRDLSSAQRLLEEALKGDSIDDLNAQLTELKATAGASVRDKDTLQSEKSKLDIEKHKHDNELRQHRQKFENLVATYETQGALLTKVADLTAKTTKLSEELISLPGLPAGFADAAAFRVRLNSLARSKSELEEQIQTLRNKLTELNARAPQQSAEESKLTWDHANEDFNRTLHRGKLIRKVAEQIENLQQEMGANRYSGLEKRFTHWAGALTGGRFKKIEMNGDTPNVFGLADDLRIPFELLSYGTKDTVSLAWRFAVSEHFLSEEGGFLVLDDPMVDMDPVRRKLASDAIREFSKKHQVLVMTCHPEHRQQLEMV